MGFEIRNLRVEDFEPFMRYVERAFGHSKGFFQRVFPQCYQPTPEACSWAYIVEENGKIVSHVGVYPIEIVTAGVALRVGGIGAVSTAPEARGKGYMTQLLYHAIDEMRRIGYPISWLGGDRQRYGTFGWEHASPKYRLEISRRALEWAKVAPVPLVEVYPAEAEATVRKFQSLPACHPIRPHLAQQLQRVDLRFWIAEDGYAIVEGQERDTVALAELVSASGNEAGMIRTILECTFGDRLWWELSCWDEERIARLMPVVSYWTAGHSAQYRINDLTELLLAARPHLAGRASALRDFAVAVGIREHDRTQVTTISVERGDVSIEAGSHAATYVELSPVTAARLFLGGPAIPERAQLPGGLPALLPVPAYVAPMEHV